MAGDAEVEQLRAAVSCAVVLEKHGYKLDEKESSRHSMKYRRGKGETIIVSHEGKGWWDTGSPAKGDVFKLAQHLDPSLNFGQVRRELGALVGMTAAFPPVDRAPKERTDHMPPELRWITHKPVTQGSPTWSYLTRERSLTLEIVAAASRAGVLREGPYASAWFAHRDANGALTGIEMRGPNYRGFSAASQKSLFRLQLGRETPTRLVITEAPIDAMSLAAIEGMRRDTLYVSTAGGMGPTTVASLDRELARFATRPGAVLVAATDADTLGDRYAARLTEMAQAANVRAERLAPAGYKDWNDVIRAGGQGTARRAHANSSPALAALVRAVEPPQPSAPLPWTPSPIPMGERIRAFQQHEALQAADAMARRSAPDRLAEPRSSPSPSPGA